MGAWSGAPFGNDSAADWAWELDGADSWEVVADALSAIVDEGPGSVDGDAASIAVAAAEVVAHQIGRPTQSDSYTESVDAFVRRAPKPPAGIVALALTALNIASSPEGELAELWAEAGDDEWATATSRVRDALADFPVEARAPAVGAEERDHPVTVPLTCALDPGAAEAATASAGAAVHSTDSGAATGTLTSAEQLTFKRDVKRGITGKPPVLGADGRPAVQPWAVGPGRIISIVVGVLGLVSAFLLPVIGIALGLLGFVLANVAWAHLRPGDAARPLTVVGQILNGAAVLLGAAILVVGLFQN